LNAAPNKNKVFASAVRLLSACASIFKIKIAESMQYRTALISNASVGIFWGIIEVIVYGVFYRYASDASAINAAALTWRQMVSYIWLMQIMLALAPHNIDGDLIAKIDNGDIGIELCRPMDFYSHWYVKIAAGRIAPLIWRGIPVLAVALILPSGYGIAGPASSIGFALMLVSSVLSLCLGTAYAMMVSAVRMNVTWGNGPMQIILLVGLVFSGAHLPLQLWPDKLQTLLLYQPFAGYLDIPIRLYIGTMLPSEAAFGMGLQLFWGVAFVFAGRALVAARLRKTVVQGG